MKIWYQSYVDYENGASYWDMLGPHLKAVSSSDTQVDIRGITPFDSYAHPLMEWRCARQMICNAVRAARVTGRLDGDRLVVSSFALVEGEGEGEG